MFKQTILFVLPCETLPAHRQGGKAQRPAATAGGRQVAPGSGASKGVRGTPRKGERICKYDQIPTK